LKNYIGNLNDIIYFLSIFFLILFLNYIIFINIHYGFKLYITRCAYNLVLLREGKKLYNGTCELMEERLKEISSEQIKQAFPVYEPGNKFQSNTEIERDLDFLRIIKKTWEDHVMAIQEIQSLLMYMVCYFIVLNLFLNLLYKIHIYIIIHV